MNFALEILNKENWRKISSAAIDWRSFSDFKLVSKIDGFIGCQFDSVTLNEGSIPRKDLNIKE